MFCVCVCKHDVMSCVCVLAHSSVVCSGQCCVCVYVAALHGGTILS